jgi:hypothetical protein
LLAAFYPSGFTTPGDSSGKGQRLGDAREANHSPHHQDNDLQCAKPTHNL